MQTPGISIIFISPFCILWLGSLLCTRLINVGNSRCSSIAINCKGFRKWATKAVQPVGHTFEMDNRAASSCYIVQSMTDG